MSFVRAVIKLCAAVFSLISSLSGVSKIDIAQTVRCAEIALDSVLSEVQDVLLLVLSLEIS